MKVLIHPTCYSSYRLVKRLMREGVLDEVELVDTRVRLDEVLRYSALSVPWLVVDGESVAADPLSPDLVIALVGGGDLSGHVPGSVEEAVDYFVKGVVASSYASSVVAVHGSLRPLLMTGFLLVAARVKLAGLDPNEVVEHLLEREGLIIDRVMPLAVKVLAKNFLREVYWVEGALSEEFLRGLTPRVLGAWLLAKASIGRAGIPLRAERARKVAEEMMQVLEDRGSKYVKDVIAEQEEITSDEEYLSIIHSLTKV